MFGVEGTEKLYFATCANQLVAGLFNQLHRFVREHPDTKLIIIDTLQKIREASGEKYSYANDYEIIGQLKAFRDEKGICMLLVHHTRKQQADDSFDRISGTNGLLGTAYGAFILEKEKRTGNTASLEGIRARPAGTEIHSEKEYRAFDLGAGTGGDGAVEAAARPCSGEDRPITIGRGSGMERQPHRAGRGFRAGHEAESADQASECE